MDRANDIVKARMALEHPSAFLIASYDADMTAFVCVPIDRDVHRIDAVLWCNDEKLSQHFKALRKWHGAQYPEKCIVPGALTPEQVAEWNDR